MVCGKETPPPAYSQGACPLWVGFLKRMSFQRPTLVRICSVICSNRGKIDRRRKTNGINPQDEQTTDILMGLCQTTPLHYLLTVGLTALIFSR
jgi:hypothetical protein